MNLMEPYALSPRLQEDLANQIKTLKEKGLHLTKDEIDELTGGSGEVKLAGEQIRSVLKNQKKEPENLSKKRNRKSQIHF